MQKILITGATGNLGKRLVQQLLSTISEAVEIHLAVRHIPDAQNFFPQHPQLQFRVFDFLDPSTFEKSLTEIDTLFLLRPPQLSDVKKHFGPFMKVLGTSSVKEVLFLSVQGAGKNRGIPHTLIERMIKRSGKEFIFLRPSYFMQNLSTQLLADLQEKRQILLPAGRAAFVWVDLEDVARASAELLLRFQDFKMRAYNITGKEKLNFYEIADIINQYTTNPMQYRSVGRRAFFQLKQGQGMPKEQIQVLFLLHFMPRLINKAQPSRFLSLLSGKSPNTVADYIQRELLPLID